MRRSIFLKTFIPLLFVAGALCAQPMLVTVSPLIYNPDGTLWAGHITVSNPGVICGGIKIQASARDYTISAGVSIPAIQLYALASCTPAYDYNVIYYGKGRAPAFWAIPSSPAITTVAAIERNTQIPASMQLNWNQMPAGTAVGQVPTWGGASWALAIPASAAASVSSVFGRSGAVAAQPGDFTTDLVTEGGNLYFTPIRVQTAMAGLYQTPLTWRGSGISGALDQILGSAAQKPTSYFQTAIAGAPATWPSFSNIATSGSYADLSNTPTIPAAQVQSDWNASSGLGAILNKPTIPAAQVQSDWNASTGMGVILNKPVIPTTTAQITESGNLYFSTARVLSAMAGLYQAPITGAPSTWPATWPWASLSGVPSFAAVATSGSYADLSNKPTIPAAQVQSDWNASSGLGVILNKPTIPATTAQITESGNLYFTTARVFSAMAGLYQTPITGAPSTWPTFATVATSGSYADLSNKPTIPAAQVQSDWNAFTGLGVILNKPTIPSTTAQITESGNLYFTAARAVSAMAGLYQVPITGAPGTWPSTWPWASLSGVPSTFAPSAHAASHQYGGSDPVGTATPVANAIPMAGSGGTLAAGWIPVLNQSTTGNAATATALAAAPTLCFTGQAPTGILANGNATGCASMSGGSMVYPGAGVPVSTGSAWGTSLTAPTGTFADTGAANTFAAGQTQTFLGPITVGASGAEKTLSFGVSGTTPLVAPINLGVATNSPTTLNNGDLWIAGGTLRVRSGGTSYTIASQSGGNSFTNTNSFSATTTFTSGVNGAIKLIPGAEYTGSTDGSMNRTTAASHGFGASSTPSLVEIYDTSGGSGTGAKLGVQPAFFTTGAGGASAAVSATNLFTAPGSAVQQVWIITGTITPTSTWSCGSGTGTLAITIAWTDARGANSYSPISVAASSVSNAVASGTSMNGSYTFQTTIIQKSTTPATYAIAVPSGCTTVSLDYFVSAARIG